MELKSIDDLNALTEYQKIEKIQRIENKMKSLSFAPLASGVTLMIYVFWAYWAGNTAWSLIHLSLIAILIGSVGYSNVQRTELLKELFELKYGK
jgi:hypothetical protein